jgi:hypothetical protein
MRKMKDYHFHTIQNILADIPAYAAIAWLNFSNVLVDVNLPEWEQFLFTHGWLILLVLRIVNVFYDFYLKVEYENTLALADNGRRKLSFWQRLVKIIEKFWVK